MRKNDTVSSVSTPTAAGVNLTLSFAAFGAFLFHFPMRPKAIFCFYFKVYVPMIDRSLY